MSAQSAENDVPACGHITWPSWCSTCHPRTAEKDARCPARNPEAGRCRLHLGHDGNHGDGEGTVWAERDWTGANTVRKAWERSPLLRSVKAARTKCQTCDGPVEDRAGESVCVSGSYLPHPATRPIPPGSGDPA